MVKKKQINKNYEKIYRIVFDVIHDSFLLTASNDTIRFSSTQTCHITTLIVDNDTIICPRELVDKYGQEIILKACLDDTLIIDQTKHLQKKGTIIQKYRNIDSISCLINANGEITYKKLLLRQSDWNIDLKALILKIWSAVILALFIYALILIKKNK